MEQHKLNQQRMRTGTGVKNILYGLQSAPSHHYIDALDRFQKDYSVAQKQRRQQEKLRKQLQIQHKRMQQLQRQSKRWQLIESAYMKQRQRRQQEIKKQLLGIKRKANMNGLPFNPINLEYQKNPEGEKLKIKDEDHYIRALVRAHNMDSKGNSKYNPLNGENRVGIQKLIPEHLANRFGNKLQQHYQGYKIKLPQSSNSTRPY